MAGMADRRQALMWALGWWLMRRWLRRRAALAVAGVAAGASQRRRGIGAVLGAFALVAALAAGFVAWRRLSGGANDEGWEPPPDDEPLTPAPEPTPEAVAA
jgi:hypothetical protein